MSSPFEWIAAGLVAAVGVVLTAVVFAALRRRDGPSARHFANLALPCGFLPLLIALAFVGPRSALTTGVLILLLQLVSGAAESHITGRLALLDRQRKRPK